MLGLGVQRWKKLTPTLGVPFPSSLALDIDFLLSNVHYPSLGHDCDFQNLSICQFRNNSTFFQNCVWELVSLVLKITLPPNSLLGKTPNCLFFFPLHGICYQSASHQNHMFHFPPLSFSQPYPALPPSLLPSLFFSTSFSCQQMSVVFINQMTFFSVCWAHWWILISGFSPLIAIVTSGKESSLPSTEKLFTTYYITHFKWEKKCELYILHYFAASS